MSIRNGDGGQPRTTERAPLRLLRTGGGPVLPPLDAPTSIYVPGDDTARVLVLGDGPAVGFGYSDHALAISGRIARTLATVSSRGVVVDIRADPQMTPEGALWLARRLDLHRYDAVVVTLGMTDARVRTPAESWARAMVELIDHLSWAVRDDVPLVIGTVPHAPLVRSTTVPEARLDSRTDELNAALGRIALPPEVLIVPLEHLAARDSPVIEDTAALYRHWASVITAAIRDRVVARTADRAGTLSPQQEWRRQQALLRLNILDTAAEDRFDDLVALAQRSMATPVAALSFIDDRRLWVKAIRGFTLDSTDRADTFCDHTIRDDRTLVIPDASADPRFLAKPFVAGPPHFRFYAGHPIVAADGERIGSLCVLDSEPRHPSSQEISMLQELAARVQEELRTPLAG